MARQESKRRKKKKLGSYPFASVIFSIALALFVMGLFGLLILLANQLSQNIQSNIEIQVYLDRDITESRRIQLRKMLSAKEYVAKETEDVQVTYVSKEMAAQQFLEDTGEDVVSFLGDNPLRDLFVVKLDVEYQDSEKLQQVRKDIESMNGVFEVAYVENLIDSINRNLTKVSFFLIGFAVVLLIAVVILINNTIKLAMFSQRFLIRSMQLVGARSSFIKRPFLMRASFHGATAGLLASAGLYGLLSYFNYRIDGLAGLQNQQEILILFAVLLFMGAVIGYFGALRSIRKYLKMSLDELY